MDHKKHKLDEALSLLSAFGVILLLLTVIFFSFLTILGSCSLYEDKVITTRTHPDGTYTVKLLQTGVPFLLSPVSAAVALYDENGKRVDYVAFGLGNDGGDVNEKNLISAVWGEDSVTVTVKGDEESETRSYVLPYPQK